jgi:hypothetical protein
MPTTGPNRASERHPAANTDASRLRFRELAIEGRPANGQRTSTAGIEIDFAHDLAVLEGDARYGAVAVFMRRT